MKNPVLWIVVVIAILIAAGWVIFMPKEAISPEAPGDGDATENTVPTRDTSGSNTQTPNTPAPNKDTDTSVDVDVDVTAGEDQGATVSPATVTYTGSGFSPATLTVRKGTTVTFMSQGPMMWVASDDHPSHTKYDGTNRGDHCPNTTNTALDQCSAGSSYSFTFNKVGTWGYHNHSSASHHGTIVVTE